MDHLRINHGHGLVIRTMALAALDYLCVNHTIRLLDSSYTYMWPGGDCRQCRPYFRLCSGLVLTVVIGGAKVKVSISQ